MGVKVVINEEVGGFSLSEEAFRYLGLTPQPDDYSFGVFEGRLYERELKQMGVETEGLEYCELMRIARTHPKLVECVEELGSERASGPYSRLKVVEIPCDVQWEIVDYHAGSEVVGEQRRIWC